MTRPRSLHTIALSIDINDHELGGLNATSIVGPGKIYTTAIDYVYTLTQLLFDQSDKQQNYIASDSNANGSSQDRSPSISPATSYITKNDLQSKNAFEEMLRLAIIEAMPDRIPSYSRNHPPTLPSQSLHDHDDRISHEKPEEPSHPTIISLTRIGERGRNREFDGGILTSAIFTSVWT